MFNDIVSCEIRHVFYSIDLNLLEHRYSLKAVKFQPLILSSFRHFQIFAIWLFVFRRDLLNISPTLSEAAGAIVDVMFDLCLKFAVYFCSFPLFFEE